jgi:hypothetical protein
VKPVLIRIGSLVVAALLFLSPLPAPASGTPATADASTRLFEFHNAFWRDLHHTLYAFASNARGEGPRAGGIRLDPEDIAIADALEGDTRDAWQEAVDWYASHLSGRDLLFDAGMVAIGDALLVDDTGVPGGDDLPAGLREVLERVAPIHRAHWWPRHRDAGAAWQAAVEALLEARGQQIATRLAQAYRTAWFDAPVPVSLTGYANWSGAYAVLAPTRVSIATLDRRNQGIAAFEILMHEASHGMVDPLRERLQPLLAAEAVRPGANAAAVRPDLWHEILFYVTGKLVADAFPGYVPYADANGLWGRAWPARDRVILARHFDPYLAGSGSLEDALQGVVRDLMQPD